LAVRVSITGHDRTVGLQLRDDGVELEMASISPRFMMATAPPSRPTPMIATASGFSPPSPAAR
jgi:hypothetical protein